jgi:hypothetical protein
MRFQRSVKRRLIVLRILGPLWGDGETPRLHVVSNGN